MVIPVSACALGSGCSSVHCHIRRQGMGSGEFNSSACTNVSLAEVRTDSSVSGGGGTCCELTSPGWPSAVIKPSNAAAVAAANCCQACSVTARCAASACSPLPVVGSDGGAAWCTSYSGSNRPRTMASVWRALR